MKIMSFVSKYSGKVLEDAGAYNNFCNIYGFGGMLNRLTA